MESAGN